MLKKKILLSTSLALGIIQISTVPVSAWGLYTHQYTNKQYVNTNYYYNSYKAHYRGGSVIADFGKNTSFDHSKLQSDSKPVVDELMKQAIASRDNGKIAFASGYRSHYLQDNRVGIELGNVSSDYDSDASKEKAWVDEYVRDVLGQNWSASEVIMYPQLIIDVYKVLRPELFTGYHSVPTADTVLQNYQYSLFQWDVLIGTVDGIYSPTQASSINAILQRLISGCGTLYNNTTTVWLTTYTATLSQPTYTTMFSQPTYSEGDIQNTSINNDIKDSKDHLTKEEKELLKKEINKKVNEIKSKYSILKAVQVPNSDGAYSVSIDIPDQEKYKESLDDLTKIAKKYNVDIKDTFEFFQ